MARLPRTWRGLLLLALFGAVFGLGLVALWIGVLEPRSLVIKREHLAVPTLPRLRIGLFSDLHAGAPYIDEAKIRRVVDLINQGQPDIILLLGDYVIGHLTGDGVLGGKKMPIAKIASLLAPLRAPLGVYAVLGNHDVWTDVPGFKDAFERIHIRVLDDDAVRVGTPPNAFWLAGIADAMATNPDPKNVIAAIPHDGPVLAFTHSPDVFPEIPARVPLTLAGHTHGGQVRLPYFGALVVPSRYGRRYVAGLIEEGGRLLYVTTGVGTSMLPVRFRVPPEIVFLEINGRGASASGPAHR